MKKLLKLIFFLFAIFSLAVTIISLANILNEKLSLKKGRKYISRSIDS